MDTKKILVCGAGGFIGHHLCKRLMNEGHYVVAVDIKRNEFVPSEQFCNEFFQGDLRDEDTWAKLFLHTEDSFNEIYQLAADMGGAGYVFSKENDYDIMSNSALINLHAVNAALYHSAKIFYSSSACIYPAFNQLDPESPLCTEYTAYPAEPDSEYGWEKLFSERLYLSANRNKNLQVRIARFHNIFGPEGTWDGGKEKAPAAICRKVAQASDAIEIWGSGNQTRSFLYIDECVEGVIRLMNSDFIGPVNIGSTEMVSINELADRVMRIANKPELTIKHVPGFIGVNGRNSDNTLIRQKLGWEPTQSLDTGLEITYKWIQEQVNKMTIE